MKRNTTRLQRIINGIKKAAQRVSRSRNNCSVRNLNPGYRQITVRKMSGVCRFPDPQPDRRRHTNTERNIHL